MSGTHEQVAEILVIHDRERAWADLVEPPGTLGTGGAEAETFTSPDRAFQTGFWRREPDIWSFERPYDDVALILAGEAEIETDGRVFTVRAGDLLVTPKGSAGTWRIKETIVKFFAIYDRG
jgi:uncharacterized cupin superfamily protein